MGIPKFFLYISERYPCILELIKENQIPDFDNMYLDMNGIFHMCSHSKEQDITHNLSEEDIFNNIINYMDLLFYTIRPKKLLFVAVDGVAPRAKLNQQRGRRFRTAKERETLEHKILSEGKKLPENRFDSNCITPGTEFMVKLQAQLEYYIASRITTNPLWQKCKVILSGHNVPGEGEHKIIEYIRYMKGLPDYDPNLRHCLYGLDADLVMLGLCTHERNISILREDVIGRKSKALPTSQTKFYLLHLCLLKEYLGLEFQDLKTTLPFEYDLECIVDDWVLLGFILGNDFIPHLPDFHIAKGALPVLYKAYTEVLPTLGGYLNEEGYLNLQRFQAFMKTLAKYELKAFEETYVDLQYFAEKTGRKFKSEKGKVINDKPKDPELEKLTKAIDDEFDFFDDDLVDGSDTEGDPDDDDEDIFFQEFCQHKRDYYMNKLEYSEVTDDILKSQAEGYVRGLQWILHYYYHGCPSWSWHYPHHYAPCTSDIVNFKSVNLDFELGKPFLPYQQLLAVLPPASKDLLPKAYHKLMTSPDSPLKEYYPSNFETDLNGKQHEWEAVILLPIIDEGDLLKAMKECDDNLTSEEIRNNKHGPMLFYSYTSENLGLYKSPQYFPDIESNHALVKTVWRDELTIAKDLKMKSAKTDPDVFYPGFPTFKYISYKASKQRAKIRIFNNASSLDSIVLTISHEEEPKIEVLAPGLLDESVYVAWPFLTEARVVAVADAEYLYSLSNKVVTKKELSEQDKLDWSKKASHWSRQYMEKHGINIGDVKILVYVKPLRGMFFSPDVTGKLTSMKVWSEGIELCPLQTVVKDIKVYVPPVNISPQEDFFSAGSVVFTLTHMYYGAMGKVVKRMDSGNRVKVEVEVPSERKVDREYLNRCKSSYYTAYVAGQKIGINPILVGRLSGNILVDISGPEQENYKKSTVNIGLGLKFNKYQEEIPGYTKKDNYWMYSSKAINLMNEYVKKYPQIISYLSSQPKEAFVFPRQEIFPDPNGAEEIQKLLDWINSLECSQIKRVSCESQVLEKDVVLKLEKIIDESPEKSSSTCIVAKTEQLFKSDLVTSGLPPVLGAEHRLLDRVVWCKPYKPVPLGSRGYIIGIHIADNPQEIMYDILFDKPFSAGLTINCSPGRGFKTTETSFINISHGERLYQVAKPRQTNRTMVNSSRVLYRESGPSAFAQGSVNQSTPLIPVGGENPYRGIWSILEKNTSQDETSMLKKMLKIEEDDKIEENVKNFFDNLSKNPEKFMPSVSPAVMPKPWRSESSNVSVHQLKSEELPPPNTLLTGNGKRNTVRQNQESGSQKEEPADNTEVAHAGSTAPDKDIFDKRLGKKEGGTQKILESQAKLHRGLFKNIEPCPVTGNSETVKSGVKMKGGSDKSSRVNKPVQTRQCKNNVPQILPTPPAQWCRQYRNCHTDQHRNCSADELKLKPDGVAGWDYSGRHRFHNENQNNSDRVKMNAQNNVRNPNWRQQDDRKGEIRPGNEFPPPPSYYNNRRQRHVQGEFPHTGRLRQDGHQFRQENGFSQAYKNNSQVGSNNSSQKLSAVATEFIPLQALTRNRQRKPARSSTFSTVGRATCGKEVQQDEAAALPTSAQSAAQPKAESTFSHKSRRKSKIAAKFDAEWDPQG